jgi:hypothetical protein
MIGPNNLTLCSIVTSKEWAEKVAVALDFSAKQLDYQCKTLIICPQELEPPKPWIHTAIGEGLTWANYSPWILRNLTNYIQTDYALTIQYDGFIIDPSLWSRDFLDCDYIGALWPNIGQVNRIGNGGFSLRSKKFLDLSAQIEYKEGKHKGEDWVACVENNSYMLENGVNFADKILARQFSVEHIVDDCFYDKNKLETYNSFGFHDKTNKAAMALLWK